MKYGMRKGLEDIAWELRSIKNVLFSMWQQRYADGETQTFNPELYSDEYISTEECAKRLGVSDQTIRNWMAIGRKDPEKGWQEGVHYVNICPDTLKKAVFRIPWNQLIQSFAKNRKAIQSDYRKQRGEMYSKKGFDKL